MAEQKEFAEVSGLQVSNNTFTASPPGSMLQAVNCVMPQKGVIQPRNGQPLYWLCSSAFERPFALTEFQDGQIISAAPSKLSTAYSLALGTDPASTAYAGGPYNPVDCDGVSTSYGRMKFGFAAGNMYFCRSWEPMALDSPASAVRGAGLGRMPDVVAVMDSASNVSGSIGGRWLAYGSSVAYRSVLRYPLPDGTSLLSPPSGRFVVTNRILAAVGEMTRAGTNTVTVTLPDSIVTGLAVGDSFTLDPGEADFPAGTYTVATTPDQNIFTYNDASTATGSNVDPQDFDTGARPVLVAAQLNAQATTATPVRFYRSRASTTDSPSDEMFLVDERFPTSGQVTAGVVGWLDATPESVIDDPLYTNPQTGSAEPEPNFQPPIYRDTANWGERQWYSNTTAKHQLRMQMLGIGTPDGIQDGDTLTVDIDGDTIAVEFVNTITAGLQVAIEDGGTPSFNIEKTLQRLIFAFNTYAKALPSPIRMYNMTTEDGSPGMFQLERTDYDPAAFEVTASRPESWTPALDATTTVESTAERIPNGLSYSKLGQPEAVPLLNYTAVGSKNYAVARIVGLQQSLLAFKEGDGIYAVTGAAPFSVQQISTANIIAPDACAVFADAAWVYTDQGILRISDSGGSTVVSRPIETVLNELRAQFPTETYDYAFAVPYETERRIYFYVPYASGNPPSLQAYCYNNATQAWTGPLGPDALCGIVSPSQDRLMLGSPPVTPSVSRGYISRERKSQTYEDFADLDFILNITDTNVNGDPLLLKLEIEVLSVPIVGLGNIAPGDVLKQGDYVTKIKALRPDIDAQTVEVYGEAPWGAATASLYRGYEVVAQFQPSGSPVARKTLTRLSWLFKPGWFATLGGETLLLTDQVQAELEVATPFSGFGSSVNTGGGGFGVTPFGDPSPLVVDVNPLDAKWTNAAQFFPGFKTSEAWVKLRLQGFGAMVDTASAPAGRGR